MVNGISLTEDIIRLCGENQYRLVLVNCMITLGRVKYMGLRAYIVIPRTDDEIAFFRFTPQRYENLPT